MIKLKLLLEGKYEYGCVMAYIDEDYVKRIVEFGLKIIDDKVLYKEGDDHGREFHPHVTIKFGLTKSYSEDKIWEFLGNQKEFKVKVKGLSLFENEKFDVVKLDIESDVLTKLNKKFSALPNEDEYPDYHPHLTLAYVNPGKGKDLLTKLPEDLKSLPVKVVGYSDRGDKSYYKL